MSEKGLFQHNRHLADIGPAKVDVGYGCQTGHRVAAPLGPLMTHKRHPQALLCCNSEGGFSPFRKANFGAGTIAYCRAAASTPKFTSGARQRKLENKPFSRQLARTQRRNGADKMPIPF